MYMGARVPNKSEKGPSGEFHVGPHIMIVSPHQDELRALSHDGSNGMPYVAHLPAIDVNILAFMFVSSFVLTPAPRPDGRLPWRCGREQRPQSSRARDSAT